MKVVVRKRKVGNIPLLEVVAEDKIYEPLPLIIYYHGWPNQRGEDYGKNNNTNTNNEGNGV